jgi:hypothetical protein
MDLVFGRRAKIVALALSAVLIAAVPVWGQRRPVRPRATPSPTQEQKKEAQKERAAARHAGDWLRRYRNLPPDQQRQALEKDPDFQKLPPHRQAQLLQEQQRFLSLPPQKQERILNRMEIREHLTPEQRRQRNQLNQQIRGLPLERRQAVIKAIRGMRDLTPEQREQLVNSDDFKDRFSDHERDLLSGAARLPLAPNDGAPQE